MKTLFELQNNFFNYLLHDDQTICQAVISTAKMHAADRLAIYSNAYQARLLDALTANYPSLSKYWDDDTFSELALAYLAQYPSTYRSIRWFGDQFATFLCHHVKTRDYPHLSELAQLEWIMSLVFDAADQPVLTLQAMAQIPATAWVDMYFLAHPSVYRVNLQWNTLAIWETLYEDKTPPEPILSPQSQPWILWRKEYRNQYISLEEDAAWACDALLKQVTFGEICEGLCQWKKPQDAALQAASLLNQWISAGLISKVMLPH